MNTIQKRSRIKSHDTLTAWMFLSPWIIGFILFSGLPILACFLISLTDWNLIQTPKLTGLKNYVTLLTAGPGFLNSLKVTLLYTGFSVLVTVVWALFTALLLNMKTKLNGVFQFFYFIPAVIPTVSLAFAFQIIFNQHTGILNYLLTFIGIKSQPNWLFDIHCVLPSVVFVSIYTYATGQMMLIFKAGLADVPKELYEAAEIDGAGFFQKFTHITLPSISPVLLFNMVTACIGSLNNSFSLIFPLTNGGPNDATNVLSLSIYTNAFGNYRMGYASALSVVLFLIAAALALLQFYFSKKWVYYETE
jgi:multiple sugar transport system permease protein